MPLILGPWRIDRKGHVTRSKVNFDVTPDVHAFLSEVAWESSPANAVSERMNHASQHGGLPVSRWLPLAACALAYFATPILLPLFVPDPPTAIFAMLAGCALAGGLSIWAAVRLMRFHDRFADQRVMASLMCVLQRAEGLRRDVTSVELRLQLVKEVHRSARMMDREFLVFGLPRTTRKLRTRHARQCSMVLKGYADSALHGDFEAISKLKADFARAVLRVGSGNWTQIISLDPSVPSQRRLTDVLPTLNPKLLASAFLPLVGVILQTVVKAMYP